MLSNLLAGNSSLPDYNTLHRSLVGLKLLDNVDELWELPDIDIHAWSGYLLRDGPSDRLQTPQGHSAAPEFAPEDTSVSCFVR